MSPFNAPLILFKKKEEFLNKFHPLPIITDILDQLGQCQLFSLIDFKSGYFQVKLAEDSRELTAFSTGQGHYQFKRLVMGLSSAPATFQKNDDECVVRINRHEMFSIFR